MQERVDVISSCNLSYAAMLSSMTEISEQDLNNQGRSRSVDREGIRGKQIRSNRSLHAGHSMAGSEWSPLVVDETR